MAYGFKIVFYWVFVLLAAALLFNSQGQADEVLIYYNNPPPPLTEGGPNAYPMVEASGSDIYVCSAGTPGCEVEHGFGVFDDNSNAYITSATPVDLYGTCIGPCAIVGRDFTSSIETYAIGSPSDQDENVGEGFLPNDFDDCDTCFQQNGEVDTLFTLTWSDGVTAAVDLYVPAANVPEPSTICLTGLGTAFLIFFGLFHHPVRAERSCCDVHRNS